MNDMQLVYLGLIFVFASALAYGLGWLILRPRTAQDRLKTIASGAPMETDARPQAQWQAKVAKIAAPIAKLAVPDDGWEGSGLRTRFMNAGVRHPSAPVLYFGAKAALAIGLPVLFMLYAGISSLPLGANITMFTLLVLAAIGYCLPNMVLARRIFWYQREIFEAFPDAIDLVIVCIEAGLGLDAAIARAAEELRLRSPKLADELHLVTLELRVGATRERALRNLALRTGLDEVAALVTMLVQADRFGTSIAESLRVHAEMLRTRRRLKAEEAAAKIPLKLLFPLIFCVFPSLMLVLLGPAMISVYRVLLPTMAGH